MRSTIIVSEDLLLMMSSITDFFSGLGWITVELGLFLLKVESSLLKKAESTIDEKVVSLILSRLSFGVRIVSIKIFGMEFAVSVTLCAKVMLTLINKENTNTRMVIKYFLFPFTFVNLQYLYKLT